MSYKYIWRRAISLFITALALLIIGGCSEDSNPLTDRENHFEAVGMIFYQSGVTVWDYYGPAYALGDSVAVFDTLKASQGLNPHWDVKFYNADSVVIDPPDDADKSFGAIFTDPSIAELWWHEGEAGEFEFHLKGLKEGRTTAAFKVFHGSHADFTTLPIPIVIGAQVLHGEPVGVRLKDEESGTVLATAYLAGSAEAVTGSIALDNGTTTDHIEAFFFDDNDIEFWPDAPPHSLVVESSNEAVASITGRDPAEPWAFKVQGNSSGSCTITVYLYHDGSVGATFKTIPVTVN